MREANRVAPLKVKGRANTMADLYVKAGFGPSGRFVLQGGEYIDPDGRGKANIAALRVYARRQIVQRLVLICSDCPKGQPKRLL